MELVRQVALKFRDSLSYGRPLTETDSLLISLDFAREHLHYLSPHAIGVIIDQCVSNDSNEEQHGIANIFDIFGFPIQSNCILRSIHSRQTLLGPHVTNTENAANVYYWLFGSLLLITGLLQIVANKNAIRDNKRFTRGGAPVHT